MSVKLIASAGLAVLLGCQSAQKAIGPEIPEGARFIGGGSSVTFTAPCDGILYGLDPGKGAVTGSFSLEEGITYSIVEGRLEYKRKQGADFWQEIRSRIGHEKTEFYFLPMTELLRGHARDDRAAFLKAVEKGDVEAVRSLLEATPELAEATDEYGLNLIDKARIVCAERSQRYDAVNDFLEVVHNKALKTHIHVRSEEEGEYRAGASLELLKIDGDKTSAAIPADNSK